MKGLPSSVRFLLVLFGSYVVLSIVFLAFPSTFPRVLAPVLQKGAALVNRGYRVEEIGVENGEIQVKAVNFQLTRFTKYGVHGPEFTFDATLDGRLVNIYPVIVLSLILACPGLAWKSKCAAVLISLPLMVIVGFLDFYILSLWQNAQAVVSVIPDMGFPSTPENEAAYAAIGRGIEHLKVVKSFLSTGGRQFAAIMVCLLSVAPFFLQWSGKKDGESSPAPPLCEVSSEA